MQSVSSRIWTRIDVFISYGDTDYTTGTSLVWELLKRKPLGHLRLWTNSLKKKFKSISPRTKEAIRNALSSMINFFFFVLKYLLTLFNWYWILKIIFCKMSHAAKMVKTQRLHQNSRGCPRGVMVKAVDCGIAVSEFVLQSRYHVHFQANTLGKGMNSLITPPMG